MKNNKKIWSILFACILLILIVTTACGKSNNINTQTGKAKAKIRIMHVSTDQNQLDIMNKYIKPSIGEKFPNIDIEFEPGGGSDDFNNKLKTYNASGDLPDIWYSGTDSAVAIINAGNMLDLTPYITKDGFINNYSVPEAIKFSDGKIYALGSGADTYFTPRIFYHKDIFEEHNLRIPQTWSEFVTLCETLKKSDIPPISVFGKGGWAQKTYLIQTMIQTVDPEAVLALLENKIDFTDPRVLQGIQKIEFMAKNDFFPVGVVNLDYGPSLEMFTNKRTAMFGGFSWEVGNLSSDPNIGMFMWPTDNTKYKTEDVTQFWGSPLGGYAVNSNSKEIEISVAVAEYCALMEATYYAEQGAKLNLQTGIHVASENELVSRNIQLYDETTLKIPTLMLNAMDTRTSTEFATIGASLLTGDYSAEDFVKDFNPIWETNSWFK